MSNTNYTKFSNKKPEVATIENKEPVIEAALEETTEQKVEYLDGIVKYCKMLNVRAEPYSDADVLRTIPVDTEVMIEPFESTNDFYKVYLADGSEGFCMKKFIEIE